MRCAVPLLIFLPYLVFFSNGFVFPLECIDGIMGTPTYGSTSAIFTVCANNTIDGAPSLI
jgi:hypothetical protein